MRLKLIACEILYRELCSAVAESDHQVDIEFLPKGLHDVGQKAMFARIEEVVRAVDESAYDAILMGYALCNNGLAGLAARRIPLVVPRGHDCITLFLGSHDRYMEYFHSHPGVYFKTSGWIERGNELSQMKEDTIQETAGMNQTYEELVAKYGEDNAKFLYDQLCDMTRNYRGLTFITMGIGPDERFEQQTREEAQREGWEFEKVQGDMALIRSLVNGDWDDQRFLVLKPGFQLTASYDDGVIMAIPVEGATEDQA